MKTLNKHVLAAFFVLLSSSVVFAQSNLVTDDKGNVTGMIDGKKVQMHTDDQGNTKGTIGSARINTHTDQLGNTTGTVGKKLINTNIADTQTSPAGALNPTAGVLGKSMLTPRTPTQNHVTPGAVNNSIINTYVEDPGNTSGKGGYKNINKRSSEKLEESF